MNRPMEQLNPQDLRDLKAKIDELFDYQRATPGPFLSAVSLDPGDVVAVREVRGAVAPGLPGQLTAPSTRK